MIVSITILHNIFLSKKRKYISLVNYDTIYTFYKTKRHMKYEYFQT